MKNNQQCQRSTPNPPLKIVGQRVLIPLNLVPFMHYLNPLAISLATLKNPPGMKYTKKIFLYLKRQLLESSFKKRLLKNQQKAKFLLRNFSILYNKNVKMSQSQVKIYFPCPTKFNIQAIRQWFNFYIEHQNLIDSTLQCEDSFIKLLPKIFQIRQEGDFRSCLRIKDALQRVIQLEVKNELALCKNVYDIKILRTRIPWTETVYNELSQFGKRLWARFKCKDKKQLRGQKKQVETLKKQKIIKSKSIKKKLGSFRKYKKKQKQSDSQSSEMMMMRMLEKFHEDKGDIFDSSAQDS